MASLQWTDIEDIVLALEEKYPHVDIVNLGFTDLWQWVQSLPNFNGSQSSSNERILEAIQMRWLEERDLL